MSFQKIKTDGYWVGGRHRSVTTNIVGDIALIKKTGKENKLIIGYCSMCQRTTNISFSDNIIAVEGLGDFLKNLDKKALIASKKVANTF